MRRVAICLSLIIVGLLTVGVQPAQAHYDDVHYALNYYVARLVGYTPEQAFRIAAACVSVDYSPSTEPVHGNFNPTPVSCDNQEPRWKFHAFRDECQFPFSVFPNDSQAAIADQAIKAQRTRLYTAGLEGKNPGVYLHFYQDEVPHAAYGSAGGHWLSVGFGTFDPLGLGNLASQKPVGGTTDWLSYREERQPGYSQALFENTARTLSEVMMHLSAPRPGQDQPHQRPRPLPDPSVYLPALMGLLKGAENAYPPSLLPNVLPAFAAAYQTDKKERTPAQEAQFGKHLDGPNMEAAVKVIEAAMLQAGMIEMVGAGAKRLPDYHAAAREFQFDAEGKLLDEAGAGDRFVLTGTLKVKVEWFDVKTGKTAPADPQHPAGVILKAPKTMNGEEEYELDSLALTEGKVLEYKDLPVGNVIVEAISREGSQVREVVSLDRREKEVTIRLTRPLDWSGRWRVSIGGSSVGVITFSKVDQAQFKDAVKIGGPYSQISILCPGTAYLGTYDYSGGGKITACHSDTLGSMVTGRYINDNARTLSDEGHFLISAQSKPELGFVGFYTPGGQGKSFPWSGIYVGP